MFLHGTLKDCHSPWLLKDMEKAVQALLEAAAGGTAIRVIGDYDVDGICSSYILTKGLQILGAKVDTAIPHRVHDGYGLNEHLIRLAKQDGVQMIVTCDNGIAAAPQIKLAKELGIQVIVTDHHEVSLSSGGWAQKGASSSGPGGGGPQERGVRLSLFWHLRSCGGLQADESLI